MTQQVSESGFARRLVQRRLTFWGNDQASSFRCAAIDRLNNVNQLQVIEVSSEQCQRSRCLGGGKQSPRTSCLSDTGQFSLLLFPVPKSTMMCCDGPKIQHTAQSIALAGFEKAALTLLR